MVLVISLFWVYEIQNEWEYNRLIYPNLQRGVVVLRTFVLPEQIIMLFFGNYSGCFSLTLSSKSGKVINIERDDET